MSRRSRERRKLRTEELPLPASLEIAFLEIEDATIQEALDFGHPQPQGTRENGAPSKAIDGGPV